MQKKSPIISTVSRLVCESENYEMEMHVDVNTLLYPVEVGNKYTISLASSLSLHSNPGEQKYEIEAKNDKIGSANLNLFLM